MTRPVSPLLSWVVDSCDRLRRDGLAIEHSVSNFFRTPGPPKRCSRICHRPTRTPTGNPEKRLSPACAGRFPACCTLDHESGPYNGVIVLFPLAIDNRLTNYRVRDIAEVLLCNGTPQDRHGSCEPQRRDRIRQHSCKNTSPGNCEHEHFAPGDDNRLVTRRTES